MTALIAVGLIHGEGFRTAPQTSPLASSDQTPEASESTGRLLECVRELETEAQEWRRRAEVAEARAEERRRALDALQIANETVLQLQAGARALGCTPVVAPVLHLALVADPAHHHMHMVIGVADHHPPVLLETHGMRDVSSNFFAAASFRGRACLAAMCFISVPRIEY